MDFYIVGKRKYEIISTQDVNLDLKYKKVYPVPTDIDFCPICGERLMNSFSYAVQISNEKCIKARGTVCHNCKAFFTKEQDLFHALEHDRYNKSAYELIDKFYKPYNSFYYRFNFKYPSAFRQYDIYSDGFLDTVTIVCNPTEESKKRKILYYKDDFAVSLLIAEKNGDRFIEYPIIKTALWNYIIWGTV